jgi:hypothetical protein
MPGDPFLEGTLRLAVWRLFNADVTATQTLLQQHIAGNPEDPLGYGLSAALPFYNLVATRLRSHYGNSISGMILDDRIELPAGMRQMLSSNLSWAETRAKRDLCVDPRDINALFALCVVEGVMRDIMALVFKRWAASFSHAKTAARHARELLALNSQAYDAYFVIGFSEHLIQKIPAVFRPFTKIPGIAGENGRAIQFLEAAAHQGWYFREFARQTLLTVYLEEGRNQDMLKTLDALAAEFPQNEVYRSEWFRLTGAAR